jgi:large subunit ribosomal protein L5
MANTRRMTNLSKSPVDDLKSPKAIMLNEAVNKALEELSQIRVERSADKAEDEEALRRREEAAKQALDTALKAKKEFLESVKKQVNDYYQEAALKDSQDKTDSTAQELKKRKTDLELIEAAVSDLEAKLKEVSRLVNKTGSEAKKKATIPKSKIEEGIAAVLMEAAKTKTKTQNLEQEADKVEKKNKTTTKTVEKETMVDESGRYRLKKLYNEVVVKDLIKQFGYKNVNEVPKIEKIVVNRGLGDVKDDGKKFNAAVEELALICGQKPVVTKAKKSVANFKVRAGMNVGCMVTLRGNRMYEFLDKLISMALPRVRDFRGLNGNSFDGRGNYTFGIKEQLIFPEIKYDSVEKVRGFDITIVTTAKTDEEAKALLKGIGMPLAN